VADVPGGDKDFLFSRCDTPNPFSFPYCPNSHEDEGLYRFSITNGLTAKFRWEQVWRVYEEASGTWYTGNWESKMDFEWNSKMKQFVAKKIERVLPNIITCNECKSKPTSKPSNRLRQLGSKDHTIQPTISPAPTIETSVNLRPWQELTLMTTISGVDWFDAQHKGTSYYISSKDGNRLLSTGTMCPWETNPTSKTCWEDFPDGEYILRLGGALDRTTDHTFKYYASVNVISQETQIVFRVDNGECNIVSNIKSKNFCANEVHIVQVAMIEFSLHGASDSLGSIEIAQLSNAIARAIPSVSASGVTILSTHFTAGAVVVTAEVLIDAKTAGIDYTSIDTLDAFEASLISVLQSNVILSTLISGEVPSSLHVINHVEIHSVKLTGNKESIDDSASLHEGKKVVDFADALAADTFLVAPLSPSHYLLDGLVKVLAVVGFVLAAIGIASGIAFVMVAQNCPDTSASDKERGEQSTLNESLRKGKKKGMSTKVTEARKASSVVFTKELSLEAKKELIEQQDVALELMMKNGDAAIYS
jgi:hypothetical protein